MANTQEGQRLMKETESDLEYIEKFKTHREPPWSHGEGEIKKIGKTWNGVERLAQGRGEGGATVDGLGSTGSYQWQIKRRSIEP